MSIVVDCSVALSWVMPDENCPPAERLLERVAIDGGVVPTLFRIEVGNALLIAVRRQRITAELRDWAFGKLGELPLEQDRHGAGYTWTDCVELAVTHGLSLYDATYLELARRLGLPLATLNDRLAGAAEKAGVKSPWKGA